MVSEYKIEQTHPNRKKKPIIFAYINFKTKVTIVKTVIETLIIPFLSDGTIYLVIRKPQIF
jgi:hypothetical protein